MGQVCYINIIDDVNRRNLPEVKSVYKNASLYIDHKLESPAPDEIKRIFGDETGESIPSYYEGLAQYLINLVDQNFMQIRQGVRKELARSLLECRIDGGVAMVRKNCLIKSICWLKKYFINILDKPSTIMIYNAPMGKYEMHTLYTLSTLGINVVIITKDTSKLMLGSYKNIVLDTQGTNENIDFKEKPAPTPAPAPSKPAPATRPVVTTPPKPTNLTELKPATNKENIQYRTTPPRIFQSIDETREYLESGSTQGIKLAIIGCGEDNIVPFNNFLVRLEKHTESKTTALFKHGIPKISYEESTKFTRPQVGNVTSFIFTMSNYIPRSVTNSQIIANTVSKVLVAELANETNSTRLFSRCCNIISWVNKYIATNEPKNLIITYGRIDNDLEVFYHICMLLNIGVILISPDKSKLGTLSDYDKLDLGDSRPPFEWPRGEIREKQATVAYNASKEIDSLLYDGNTPGLYRDRQFKTCKSLLLSTTYDEIGILWHQDSQFRPHFEVRDNVVEVPNFFVKLSGFPEDQSKYMDELNRLVDSNTVFLKSPGFIDVTSQTRNMVISHLVAVNGTMFTEQKPMIERGKVIPENIISYRNYPYGFLSQDAQYHMLSKIQELLDNRCIIANQMNEETFQDMVLNVTLNLDTASLRLIQWFDFTKQIPKVVLLCETETTVTMMDCIYLAYMSLLGFDIAVIVPTAYNSIERYLSPNMYQEHIVGQAKFDANIGELGTARGKRGGFLNRLFGK